MKSLICINTCARPIAVKSMVWEYIDFVQKNNEFDFVVSLDGNDIETINYCTKYNIPLIYSAEQEGVGLSKNRVLSIYSDYDYYFFIEDDVELLNPDVFNIHIEVSKKLNLHHLSLFESKRIISEMQRSKVDKFEIIHSMYGSAQVNFFTKEGLENVGGFHDMFAKYKRFGHTEHTYRFVNAGLAKYPFNVISNCIDGYFKWNDPISVSKVSVERTQNRLFVDEEKLISEKLKYYPIKTLSEIKLINTTKTNEIKIDLLRRIYKTRFHFEMGVLNILRRFKRVGSDLFK